MTKEEAEALLGEKVICRNEFPTTGVVQFLTATWRLFRVEGSALVQEPRELVDELFSSNAEPIEWPFAKAELEEEIPTLH